MSAGGMGLLVVVAAVSSLMTWGLCSAAPALARLDQPNERSLHGCPTPRTGGLAILGSLVLGLVVTEASDWAGVSLWRTEVSARAAMWWWVLGPAVAIGAVSFWDDRYDLSPAVRFCLHGAAAIAAAWGGGVVVNAIALPLGEPVPLGWWGMPLTVLGLMWMANLYNFMDGMDGFAGGMTVLGFGTLGYVAWSQGALDMAWLAWLISAAAAGFLVFNLPPARIFMGDAGSVPLGFLAGTLAALGMRDGLFDPWVPLLVFSPFIVDATVTLFRRLARGAKVWQAHREHYYQRLVLAGWGHRRTVVAEYGLMLASGSTAVLYVHAAELVRLALLLAWAVAYILLARAVRAVELHTGGRMGEA